MKNPIDIRLRPLAAADYALILGWPPYEGEMAQMDYALRKGGWLDEFCQKANVICFAAEANEDLVGFTLLAGDESGGAEFRIALRADWTGQGIGAAIVRRTLRIGFIHHRFSRIHLIVRINNRQGLRLYNRLGFIDLGACRQNIKGVPVDFRRMVITDLHELVV